MRVKQRIRVFFHAFAAKVRSNRAEFIAYLIAGLITVAAIVTTAIFRMYEGTFTAILTLILFLIPTFIEESFRIKLPTLLEMMAILLIFCANILGEICNFYTLIPFWDDILHYSSGFMFAAFGFSLADMLNRRRKADFRLSPFFLALVALCFSVTIGVMWEFLECFADKFIGVDMQKDTIVNAFSSAKLNPDGQAPVVLRDITQTVITMADGSTLTVDGYLDIGIFDTMKDLLVDFSGALLFSVFGFFYARETGKKHIAQKFIPSVPVTSETSGEPSDGPPPLVEK